MTQEIGRLTISATRDVLARWESHDGDGRMQIATRPSTTGVSGKLVSDCHLVMVTLRGGARRHRFRTADGVGYDGADRAGMISVLPAGCERELELADVAWTWGAFFVPAARKPLAGLRSLAPVYEPCILQMFQEMEKLAGNDGGVDPLLSSSMSDAAWGLLCRKRFSGDGQKPETGSIPTWRLRRLTDFAEAHLNERLTVARLARAADMSERQLHRSLRARTGQTPLAFVTQIRVARAKRLLSESDRTVAEIALDVGFMSQSHLARVFRTETGYSPLTWRRLTSDH